MNRRDLELLSAYLDGELKPSDSAKLEVRLKSDRELVSVLDDLRAARTLLRKLPQRRAPRNFTLTRKMVGQNPPLPRAYPVFRFATALATLLFVFTFGLNTLSAQLASAPPAGIGGGGGGVESFAAEAPTTEMPAEPAAPALEEPPVALAPQPTQVPPSEDSARVVETPSAKNGEGENAAGQQLPPVQQTTRTQVPLVSSVWQIGLAVIAVLGVLFMLVMRQLAIRRWRQKE